MVLAFVPGGGAWVGSLRMYESEVSLLRENPPLSVSVHLSVLFVLTVFLSVLMVEQAAESGSRSHRVASKT